MAEDEKSFKTKGAPTIVNNPTDAPTFYADDIQGININPSKNIVKLIFTENLPSGGKNNARHVLNLVLARSSANQLAKRLPEALNKADLSIKAVADSTDDNDE